MYITQIKRYLLVNSENYQIVNMGTNTIFFSIITGTIELINDYIKV